MNVLKTHFFLAAALASSLVATRTYAQDTSAPPYLRDRGPGLPTSMFGTYVREGELLLYPFAEFYWDHDTEYSPDEFGFALDQDYRGRYRAIEGLLFASYGITDRFALELEAAGIAASLETADEDPTAIPDRIEESGLGDVEGQLRGRWLTETERRPEVFSYFETVFPLQKNKQLIGTRDWEFKLGSGVTKGFQFGTMTFRLAGEYSREESEFDFGEYAVEYLRRISPAWRIYVGVEGSQDEIELIPEAQWHLSDSMFLKLNSAVGLTSKADDWAPEIGLMMAF